MYIHPKIENLSNAPFDVVLSQVWDPLPNSFGFWYHAGSLMVTRLNEE